jgi:hypothetical protein
MLQEMQWFHSPTLPRSRTLAYLSALPKQILEKVLNLQPGT